MNDNETTSSDTSKLQAPSSSDAIHPVRRLLVFQVKLAVDALRDIALSPVAIIATIIDLVEKKRGKARMFDKLMQFGRISEKNINLFEGHKHASRTVDTVLKQVEEILVNEYKHGELSAKAKAAIESKLKLKTSLNAADKKPGEPG
jgi:hypothetical protein